MNTYQHQYAIADQRREELLREAEANRLSQTVEHPALTDRLLSNVADWMVTEGTRLKNRTAETQRTRSSLLIANR